MAKQDSKKNSIRIQDIAKELGTSASTVSRALNDHPKISKQTKQKVLDLALRLGYKPSIPSLMLDSDTMSIALVIPNSSEVYYASIVKAVSLICEKKSYALFLCETQYNWEKERLFLKQIELMNMRGMLYVNYQNLKSQEDLELLAKRNFPLVIIHENDLDGGVSTVVLDIYQALHEAIDHLVSNDAHKITLLTEDDHHPVYQGIEPLFLQLMEQNSIRNSAAVIKISSSENWQNVVDELLRESLPDALLVSSMKLAFAVQQQMKQLYGDDFRKLLIISLNSGDFDAFTSPKITYFNLRGSQIGEDAAHLLIEQIETGTVAESKALFSQLIIKSSSMKI